MARGNRPFPNPPLALTVLEIRYPDLADGGGFTATRSMKAAVREHLPLTESLTEDQIELTAGAPVLATQTIQRRVFPRFFTRDRTTALLVKENALVLQTTNYGGWEGSFRPLIEAVLGALEQAGPPDGVFRIGLRYIDEIRVPEIDSSPGEWTGYIHNSLLAAVDPTFIPASLQPSGWQGVVQYRTAGDSTLTVRYGPQEGYAVDLQGAVRRNNPPAAGPYFLLDSDSFWYADDEVPPFETEGILERCNTLHAPIREFFGIATTDKLRNDVFGRKAGNTW